MKTIILQQTDGKNHLSISETPIPTIKEDEVLIKVNAISINPVDVKTEAGAGIYAMLKREDSIILGWDVSGVVVEVGKEVTQFKTGDAVFGMVNFPGHGKAYAEYVAAPANQLAKKPANITHEAAAASTLAALTAWQFLVKNANIRSIDRVLIHAAAGGVGHFAVQIAKYIGAYVIGTSSIQNKDYVLSLGADQHIDYKNEKFEDIASDIDVVLDTIGKDYIERSLAVVKKGGRIISTPTTVNKDLTEKAAAQNVKAYFLLVESNGEDMQKIAELLEQGVIKPHIFKTYPFAEMEQAHQQVASGTTVGKVIVLL